MILQVLNMAHDLGDNLVKFLKDKLLKFTQGKIDELNRLIGIK